MRRGERLKTAERSAISKKRSASNVDWCATHRRDEEGECRWCVKDSGCVRGKTTSWSTFLIELLLANDASLSKLTQFSNWPPVTKLNYPHPSDNGSAENIGFSIKYLSFAWNLALEVLMTLVDLGEAACLWLETGQLVWCELSQIGAVHLTECGIDNWRKSDPKSKS